MKKCLLGIILILFFLNGIRASTVRVGYPAVDTTTAVVLKEKGIACMRAQRYLEAIGYFVQGMETAQKEHDKQSYYACIANIGSVYGYLGNFEHSLYYLSLAYNEAVKNKDRDIQSEIIINLIGTYCRMGDVENAKKYFIVQTQVPIKNMYFRRYYFLYNQALISQLDQNWEAAGYYHQEAAQYALDNSDTNRAISQYLEIGRIALNNNHTESASIYAVKAVSLAQETGNLIKLGETYDLLASLCEIQGYTDSARIYRHRRLVLSDSIFNQSQLNRANNQLFDYEKRVSNRQINLLYNRIHVQTRVLVTFAVVVLLMGILIFFILRYLYKLRNAQHLLIAKNEELMRSEERLRLSFSVEYKFGGKDDDLSSMREDKKNALLGPEQTRLLLSRITNVMQDVAVYSRSDFNLNVLASLVDSNTKYISWVINNSYGKNFKDFLNEYRIREACRRLADVENYGNITIQAIYESLGYNSPGGFIKAFKKVNGMTPSVYLKLSRQKSKGSPG